MLRTRLNGRLLFSALVALSCATVSAQPPEGGRRPGGFGGPGGGGAMDLMLLGNEKVQKELELVPDQVADLTKLREAQQGQFREMFSGFRDLNEEERRAKFEGMREKMEEQQKENRGKVKEILLPHQQDRLQEIALQLRGFGAIGESDVAEKLKLSEEQKEKISSLRTAQREKVGAMFREGGRDADRDAMREKFTKLREENEKELTAVLSSEQQTKFEKMKGEKFEIDMSTFRGPGGPGGERGGRFGGRRPDGDGNRGDGNRPAPQSEEKK